MDPETKTYPKIFGRTEDRDKQQEIEKKIDKAEDARIDVLKALTADEAYEVAEKKPIDTKDASSLGINIEPRIEQIKVEEPPVRQKGIMVSDVAELVQKLKHEAKVI